MNFGFGLLGQGNPANKTIGRTSNMMWRNIGGAIPSVTTTSNWGDNPATNGGFCIAEYAGGLPEGWKGLNEEDEQQGAEGTEDYRLNFTISVLFQ